MKHLRLILFAAAALLSAFATGAARAQNANSAAERDSLFDAAVLYRSQRNYTAALNIYDRLRPAARARLAMAETHLEMGLETDRRTTLSPAQMGYGTYGKVTNLVELALKEAKEMRADKDFALPDEALLLEARCRRAQGFDRAARRIYRRLEEKGSAEAHYYHAEMLYAQGHLAQAADLCQKAVAKAPQLAPAHLLLMNIELGRGHRYQALLPLYRYLLTASDEGRREAAPKLRSLWRAEPMQMQLFGTRPGQEPFSARMETVIDSICAAAGPLPSAPDELIEHLAQKTDALLARARDMGEENLDFWQVAYADFFIEVQARGYVRPMLYFMFSPVYNTQSLLWVNDNMGLFNEFRMWMEGRVGER